MCPMQFDYLETCLLRTNCCLFKIVDDNLNFFFRQFFWDRLTFFERNCARSNSLPGIFICIQCMTAVPGTMMTCFSSCMCELYAGHCVLCFDKTGDPF